MSVRRAEFSGTRILCVELSEEGETLLVYQNEAVSRVAGGNAMLLLIPSAEGLSADNMVDLSKSGRRLFRELEWVAPVREHQVPLEACFGGGGGAARIVRGVGIYDVVLADNVAQIPAALLQIEERKRPYVSEELLSSLQVQVPDGYSFVVACFDNIEKHPANPIGLTYRSLKPGTFHFPALDGHDGRALQMEEVEVDHRLYFGSLPREFPVVKPARPWSAEARRSTFANQHPLAALLPSSVRVTTAQGWAPNGDFHFTYDQAAQASVVHGRTRVQLSRGIMPL